MKLIAALFVEKNGCYSGLDFVDLWDIERDARKYIDEIPVVAHPPCQLWGNFAVINFNRWGGEHNRPGNDGDCFESALNNVIRCGGVLEHPAKSKAFLKYGLGKPEKNKWTKNELGGWICEVWQSAYGHKANKATWLFYSGKNEPHELRWTREIGSHQIGYRDQRGKSNNKPTVTKKEAIATPILFRNELIKLTLNANL